MKSKIYNTDCLEAMKKIKDNSISSVVTDPPYGIGFCGMEWDTFKQSHIKEKGYKKIDHLKQNQRSPSMHAGRYDLSLKAAKQYQDWCYVWALECLRILKPGGHLLASNSSRMYHRMAVAIEDAGFEIRDQIMWVYASGFPKSLNIKKSLEKHLKNDYIYKDGNERKISDKQNPEHGLRPMPKADIQETKLTDKKQGEVLRSELSEQSTHSTMSSTTSNDRGKEPSMERRSNLQEGKGELQGCPLCEMPDGIFTDGEEGRVHLGTQTDDGTKDRKIINKDRGSSSHRPQPKQQRTIQFDAICDQCRAQILRRHDGWGTALKPAHEPIVVARKPLDGTVANNILKWGTGGINIDGCRIGMNPDDPNYRLNAKNHKWNKNEATSYDMSSRLGNRPIQDDGFHNSKGRFPSNLIHDGSEEVEEVFPYTESGGGNKGGRNDTAFFGSGSNYNAQYEPDSGSASRFFYCAKASKSERNYGLDSYEIVSYICVWKEKNIIQEGKEVKHLVDMDTSLHQDTDVFGVLPKKDLEWNIESFGKFIMVQFLKECKSITKMEIKSITESKILNALHHYIINGNIQGVNCEMVNGSSLVLRVEKLSQLVNIIIEKTAFVINVNPALLKGQLEISVNAKQERSEHPTVKPLELMRYLIRLVTPPDGICLDPFMGSGTTGMACKLEGFDFIGIEKEKEYCDIAKGRIETISQVEIDKGELILPEEQNENQIDMFK